MAQQSRRRSGYETYGNVAYDPAWTGRTSAAPRREEDLRPRPRVRPKERTLARPRARVRQAGLVSPFAVIGFLAVGIFAMLLLSCATQLAVVTDEVVQLRSELNTLKEEEAKLLVQYELAYDLQAIEAQLTANGSMVKPAPSQIVVLDMSEPDNVIVYGKDSSGSIFAQIKSFFGGILSYFTA